MSPKRTEQPAAGQGSAAVRLTRQSDVKERLNELLEQTGENGDVHGDDTPGQVAAAAPRRTPARPGPRPGQPRVPLDPNEFRPTNVMLDEALDRRVGKLKKQLGLSHGDLVIMAIETEHETVATPAATKVGGGLFAPRPAASRGVDRSGATKAFTFRLREADFTVIDHLVTERGFANRKEFISACLEAFCERHKVT